MKKIKILPSYSKIDRLFLTFPTMENRISCIDEFLKLIYTICSTIEYLKLTIICDKGKIDYIKELIFNYNEENNSLFDLIKKRENIFIDFFESSVVDIWIRDYAFIGNGINNDLNNSLLKSTYYPRYALETCLTDDACGRKICEKYSPNSFTTIPFILDGGNVVCNDDFIICTEELFIENYKNFSMKEIQNYFEQNFEQKLIILPKDPISPISHSDSILAFLNNKTVLLPSYPNSSEYRIDEKYVSEVYKILKENLSLDTEYIFIPSDLSDEINDCVFSDAYNYINFLQLDNCIYMPSFIDGKDYEQEIAYIFKKKFSNLNLYFIPCNNIAKGGGGIHCITNTLYHNINEDL